MCHGHKQQLQSSENRGQLKPGRDIVDSAGCRGAAGSGADRGAEGADSGKQCPRVAPWNVMVYLNKAAERKHQKTHSKGPEDSVIADSDKCLFSQLTLTLSSGGVAPPSASEPRRGGQLPRPAS